LIKDEEAVDDEVIFVRIKKEEEDGEFGLLEVDDFGIGSEVEVPQEGKNMVFKLSDICDVSL
jgi:hypothetical protein